MWARGEIGLKKTFKDLVQVPYEGPCLFGLLVACSLRHMPLYIQAFGLRRWSNTIIIRHEQTAVKGERGSVLPLSLPVSLFPTLCPSPTLRIVTTTAYLKMTWRGYGYGGYNHLGYGGYSHLGSVMAMALPDMVGMVDGWPRIWRSWRLRRAWCRWRSAQHPKHSK